MMTKMTCVKDHFMMIVRKGLCEKSNFGITQQLIILSGCQGVFSQWVDLKHSKYVVGDRASVSSLTYPQRVLQTAQSG